MDKNSMIIDIKTNLVRAGKIFKRSKFLKEWRSRYLVLTSNYLYTFTDEKMEEVTDQIKVKDLKSYKSYLRKDQEMIPPGFKLRSSDDMLYLCAKDCNEKWSWIVTIQRLLDYTYMGANAYNNLDWVKTRGFDSQTEYENGGNVAPPPPVVKKQVKSSQDAKKQVDDEVEKILQHLEQQQKMLQKRKKELQHRQSTILQQQRKLQDQKQFYSRISLQERDKAILNQDDSRISNRVAQLKNMYENRMTAPQAPIPNFDPSKYENKPAKKEDVSFYRGVIVNSLFEEFRKDCDSDGLKYVVQFLINAGGSERMGYSSYVIIEGKSHQNRLIFSQEFINLLNNFVDYENCQNLMKFIEICVYQIPGLFTLDQTSIIQKKLRDIFQLSENEQTLALILKNMFILHRMKKYQKDDIYHKLDRLVKEVRNEETRNWARKLRDIL